jgi:integrase
VSLQPFSVIARKGIWNYREKGWKSGRYVSLEIHDTGKASEKEAWAKASTLFKKDEDRRSGAMRLREYADLFYGPNCPHTAARVADGGSIRTRTAGFNRRAIQRDLLGKRLEDGRKTDLTELTIMGLRVREVTPRDTALAKKELVAKLGFTCQAKMSFALLRTILKTAYEDEMIPKDPLLKVSPIKYKATPRSELSGDQTETLFQRENFRSDLAYAIFRLAYLTGMRCGEILALGALHPDFPEVQITDERILVDRAWKDDAFMELGPPKSNEVREVPMTDPIRKHLEWWKSKNPFQHDGLLFRDKAGRPVPRSFWKMNWIYATDAAGIKRTNYQLVPHSLRHTLATDLDEAGVPSAVIRDALGWGDESIRKRYTHVRQAHAKSVMGAAMDKIAGGQ